MSSLPNDPNPEYFPEIMNTSRVTNRSTYNSKSKCNSSLNSLHLSKQSTGSKRQINSNVLSFHTEQIIPSSLQPLSQGFTNKKVPIYREEESLLKSHLNKRSDSSLLFSQLSKRTSNSYQPKQRQSLFFALPYRQRILKEIEQQRRSIAEMRITVSSIDSVQQQRGSSSTDISEE